jgi:hypothetical protein
MRQSAEYPKKSALPPLSPALEIGHYSTEEEEISAGNFKLVATVSEALCGHDKTVHSSDPSVCRGSWYQT